MRVIPSVTAITVPTSRASAALSKLLMRSLIRALISSFKLSFDSHLYILLIRQRRGEFVQTGAYRSVNYQVVCLQACSAYKCFIEFKSQTDIATEALLERIR